MVAVASVVVVVVVVVGADDVSVCLFVWSLFMMISVDALVVVVHVGGGVYVSCSWKTTTISNNNNNHQQQSTTTTTIVFIIRCVLGLVLGRQQTITNKSKQKQTATHNAQQQITNNNKQ